MRGGGGGVGGRGGGGVTQTKIDIYLFITDADIYNTNFVVT